MNNRVPATNPPPLPGQAQADGDGANVAASGACHFCGLPLSSVADGGAHEVRYCCYGCRFAASITASGGEEGLARLAMTRLALAIFFTMNVMVFTMLLWSQPAEPAGPFVAVWYDLARYACLLFTLPVVLLLGGPLVEDAIAELKRGRSSLSLLLCGGVAAALAYSIWSLLAGEGHVYFEVAATILVAVTLGRWLEATGKLKTTAALRELKRLLPDRVRLLRGDDQQLVAAQDLAPGNIFRVLPGERIAADGRVVRFQAAVDEQAITGESLPVFRKAGDGVISGSLVIDGPLDVCAIARVADGTLSHMVEAVARATAARSRYERLAERISRWFLPAVGGIAAGTYVIHVWLGDAAGGLLAALAVLVIACPCALGLATPMALWAAVGRCARAGVLIREGDALAALAGAKAACFDKTGTLTTGDAAVAAVFYACSGEQPNHRRMLSVARALSRASTHPLAVAVGRYVDRELSASCWPADQAIVRPGRGIAGYCPEIGATAFLGSRNWMAECGQEMPEFWTTEGHLAEEPLAATIGDAAAESFLAWEGKVWARFAFRESIRPEGETTITLLRRLGLGCTLLTGDRPARAKVFAEALGVHWFAGLLPENKLTVIRSLQSAGPVIMVGDGINDAPALAAADVGVALGSGTDISRHSAQVCLLTSDLARLPWLIELARRTQRTIRWNLVWAFAYNVAGIGLAAAGRLHPVLAAIAMGLSSLLVITNSLALARDESQDGAAEERE